MYCIDGVFHNYRYISTEKVEPRFQVTLGWWFLQRWNLGNEQQKPGLPLFSFSTNHKRSFPDAPCMVFYGIFLNLYNFYNFSQNMALSKKRLRKWLMTLMTHFSPSTVQFFSDIQSKINKLRTGPFSWLDPSLGYEDQNTPRKHWVFYHTWSLTC